MYNLNNTFVELTTLISQLSGHPQLNDILSIKVPSPIGLIAALGTLLLILEAIKYARTEKPRTKQAKRPRAHTVVTRPTSQGRPANSSPTHDSVRQRTATIENTQPRPTRSAAELAAMKRAGDWGEEQLKSAIRSLMGRSFNGYIATPNLCHLGEHFEIDCLVMAHQRGLVLAEVKNYRGTTFYSGDRQWVQDKDGTCAEIRNASLQVLRTRRLLLKLCKASGIHMPWIHPVVVMAHPTGRPAPLPGGSPAQTDVIHIDEFSQWTQERPLRENLSFDRSFHEKLTATLQNYVTHYPAAA